MELEFDKEIDAILRKAASGVAVASAASPHVDADAIAAFAENALPDKAKLLYMGHFADCDRCRQQLSHAIRMNNEAVAAAAPIVSAPLVEMAVPWYQKLFKTQNLALGMGALVLVFSGVLGYLVLQKQNPEAANATVSQMKVTESDQTRGGPYFGGEVEMPNANTTASNAASAPANVTTQASNSAAILAPAVPGTSSNTAPDTFGRVDKAPEKTAAGEDNPADTGGTAGLAATKPVAPPPPPLTIVGTTSERERDEKKSNDDSLKEESKDVQLAKRKQAEDRRGGSHDLPAAASKAGPSRSGPLQSTSNQVNSNIYEMPVTRVVSGKRFNNRNGAWVDSAYQGQPTTNVRRGTNEYKKLDGGLRNTAGSFSGTVIVVWKDKAYRIQ